MNDKIIYGALISAVVVLLAVAALRPRPEPLAPPTTQAPEQTESVEETGSAEGGGQDVADTASAETDTVEDTAATESEDVSSEEEAAASESDSIDTEEQAASDDSDRAEEDATASEGDTQAAEEQAQTIKSDAQAAEEQADTSEGDVQAADEQAETDMEPAVSSQNETPGSDDTATNAARIAALEERIAALEERLGEGSSDSGGTDTGVAPGEDAEVFGVGSTAILNDGDIRVFVSSIANDTVRFAVNGLSLQTAESGSEVELENGCTLSIESVEDIAARFAATCD